MKISRVLHHKDAFRLLRIAEDEKQFISTTKNVKTLHSLVPGIYNQYT